MEGESVEEVEAAFLVETMAITALVFILLVICFEISKDGEKQN